MSFLGIDIGTTTICAMLYDAEQKSICHIRRVENDSNIPTAHEWEHIQDPSRILELVSALIAEFERMAVRIDGIGFSAQMHGIVYVNKDGKPASPFYSWQDNRASQLGPSGKSFLENYTELTGASLSAGFGLATHFSLMQSHQLPSEPCTICPIADFVALQLSGNTSPVTDASLAHSFGVYDLHTNTFRHDELSSAGISVDILPEIVASYQIVGKYKNAPIVTAIGDN